ncbi:MAG: sodium:proton antiporter [Psittacicella sp.]
MTVYTELSLFFGIAVLITYFNEKIKNKLEITIVLTGISLLVSFTLYLLKYFGISAFENRVIDIMHGIDFENFVLNGILGFLIFAGSLNIDLAVLKTQKWEVAIFSLLSTLISTFIIGFLIFEIAKLVGINIPLVYTLLFGALISPTDPIAVLAIVKILKAPKRLSIQIEGESLFNDGIGLVIFLTIFAAAYGGSSSHIEIGKVLGLFLHQSIGGIIFGGVIWFVLDRLIMKTKEDALITLLTILGPTTGYVLALIFDFSGPLAMVVSGILIGNITLNKKFISNTDDGLSPQIARFEKQNLLAFWSMIEHFLNSVLFLLIGFAFVLLTFHTKDIILMFLAIPVCLLARYLSLRIPFTFMKRFKTYNPYTMHVLTWGGLRGALGLAMALSIPNTIIIVAGHTIDIKNIILLMTYATVIFSILVQGSTIKPFILKSKKFDLEKIENEKK